MRIAKGVQFFVVLYLLRFFLRLNYYSILVLFFAFLLFYLLIFAGKLGKKLDVAVKVIRHVSHVNGKYEKEDIIAAAEATRTLNFKHIERVSEQSRHISD